MPVLPFEEELLFLPVIGAAIGWITNYVAVKMLFHPRKPISFLFFEVQGVFPRRQKDLARKLGEIVSTELISAKELTHSMAEKATSDEMLKLVADRIEMIITQKLPSVIPMIAMVLTPELVNMVKNAFMADLRGMISDLIESLSGQLNEELDVHQIVEEKVANFSVEKLENIIFTIMRREFRFVEFVGAVLGFLIGIAQISLIVYDVI